MLEDKFKRYIVLYVGVILWINQPGSVEGAKCGRPGRTAHSTYDPMGNEFEENVVIHYSCDKEDEVLLGVQYRRCLWNGSWSDEIPVCSKEAKFEMVERSSQDSDIGGRNSFDGNISTCTELPQYDATIWRGYLASSVNVTAIRIAILVPYDIDIDIDVTVQGEGNREKRCLTKKSGSEVIAKSIKILTLHCPTGTIGNIVHLNCNNHALRICEVSVILPPVQACLMPDTPLNGQGYKTSSSTETLYTFHCNPGYKKWGAVAAMCQADGTWSPRSPKCEKIYCHVPENIPNGYVEYNQTSLGVPYNGTATYSCHDGYYLDGPSTIRCYMYDTWDSLPPKCELISTGTSVLSSSTLLTETSILSSSTLLTETRIESNDENCGTLKIDENSQGKWLPVSGSSSLQFLICPEGYIMEGSPAVTQCLPNGSWSYTSAICKNSFESMWGSNWTPSLILIAAVAAGAGTAIFILCLSVVILVLKKRRRTRTSTTVFHLQNSHQEDGMAEKNIRHQKHFSAMESFENIVERRSKTADANLRKPRSALPTLPLDTDPVYAQPFETPTTKKLSNATSNRKEDIYNTHIYAEPIDSRITSAIILPVNKSVPRVEKSSRQSVVKTNFDNEQAPSIPISSQNSDKTCAIYDSSNISIDNITYETTDDIQRRYSKSTDTGTFKKKH